MSDAAFKTVSYSARDIAYFAATRETSDVVARAIFEIAAAGDENRLWADPNDGEKQSVTTRAWELAGGDEDTLHWGSEILRRR